LLTVPGYGLEELVISYNTWRSEIHLTGFFTLQKLFETKEKNSDNEKGRFVMLLAYNVGAKVQEEFSTIPR
jgi:sialic acid synthase SpsE